MEKKKKKSCVNSIGQLSLKVQPLLRGSTGVWRVGPAPRVGCQAGGTPQGRDSGHKAQAHGFFWKGTRVSLSLRLFWEQHARRSVPCRRLGGYPPHPWPWGRGSYRDRSKRLGCSPHAISGTLGGVPHLPAALLGRRPGLPQRLPEGCSTGHLRDALPRPEGCFTGNRGVLYRDLRGALPGTRARSLPVCSPPAAPAMCTAPLREPDSPMAFKPLS